MALLLLFSAWEEISRLLEQKADGTGWFIGIRAAEENRYLGGVFVKDKAVVTSGGYERYFAGDDGQIYWHIMDPKPALRPKTVWYP